MSVCSKRSGHVACAELMIFCPSAPPCASLQPHRGWGMSGGVVREVAPVDIPQVRS